VAREKDEAKRRAILAVAKRLFAERGFHGTSVADMARETGLPVGSIYTYFENKEALMSSVLEEGWNLFFDGLGRTLAAARNPEEKLALLVYRSLPSLFEDLDLISILLTEAVHFAGLEDKLERLTSLIAGVVLELAAEKGLAFELPPRQAMAALSLFLLGSLDTVRLSRAAGLAVGSEDILGFIRLTIENTFQIRFDPGLAGLPPASPA